jgi:phosphoserine aminotransferase
MPEITIPSDILPKDGRFGCGPSRLRSDQLRAFAADGMALMGTSHRQKPIKNLVKEVQEGLLELFRAPEGYEIVLGNGGSTAFWEVAAYSLANSKSQALVHGEFGSKFAKSLKAPFLGDVTLRQGDAGSRISLEATTGIKNYVYPQNETSTGVMTPVKRLAGVDEDALFFTDATSAAGGIDFDAGQTDVYYFAPQKNFGSDGGLWLSLVSPAAIERAEQIAASDRYIPEFLSFQVALENSRLNQTLNTPAIATLYLLNEQIKWMLSEGGLLGMDARTKASSKLLYDWADSFELATPFVSDPNHRSQVVVTIDFAEELDAKALASHLRDNGIVDVDPYRKLGRNQIRVATFASTDSEDIKALIRAIEFVIDKMTS